MWRNRLLYLAGLIAALVFHIFYFGWYSWFVLVLALSLPWFVLLVSLPAMLKTCLSLEVPGVCRTGEEASVILSVSGETGCKLRLTVRCPLIGERKVVRRTFRGIRRGKLPLDTAHCGLLLCSMRGSRVCDYLGLFSLPIRGAVQQELLVLPRPMPPEKLPDLTRFSTGRRKPKPGGGFAEEHEMRDYRPGDSLRDIHWKLSAKTDRLILREAQEPIRERVLLTLDLQGPRAVLDGVLSRLLWLSRWLLKHEVEHRIGWFDPEKGVPVWVQIQREEDLQPMLHRILSSPLKAETPSMEGYRFTGVCWRYHVAPEQEVQP